MSTQPNVHPFPERRRRRSENTLTAIRYQLEQVMEDFSLDGCVLATTDGRLFAAPEDMDRVTAEKVAAVAPLASAPIPGLQVIRTLRACFPENRHTMMSAHKFWIFDQPVLVATVGNVEPARKLSLFRIIMGVRRITQEQAQRAA